MRFMCLPPFGTPGLNDVWYDLTVRESVRNAVTHCSRQKDLHDLEASIPTSEAAGKTNSGSWPSRGRSRYLPP